VAARDVDRWRCHAAIDFDCFEQGTVLGGNWAFGSPWSAAYRTLHINSYRADMEYADFPMPTGMPDFPHHEQVAAYFNAYADHFELMPPVGQLAWVVDKFKEWAHPSDQLPEHSISRDQMLANVMLYWLTGTAGSSARFYYENMHSGPSDAPASRVPTGVAVFAEDVAIRRYAESANNIVHWSDFDRGGHFAAMEVPELLTGDVQEFFRRLR
jgi:pimeloyl-ACP methyl ester carboxylesterase